MSKKKKSLKKLVEELKRMRDNPHHSVRHPVKPTKKHKDKSKYSRKDKHKVKHD